MAQPIGTHHQFRTRRCADDWRVCIPQRGGKKTAEREDYEKSREFKKGQRFRVP
jgi:hypothetical protein